MVKLTKDHGYDYPFMDNLVKEAAQHCVKPGGGSGEFSCANCRLTVEKPPEYRTLAKDICEAIFSRREATPEQIHEAIMMDLFDPVETLIEQVKEAEDGKE